MRLRKLKLKNFRGYRNSTEIIIDESMTGIVGRNDFGKSTLLEALAIFFETEGMKADKNDMNCFSLREGDARIQIITATPMVHRREEANCRFWYA
uniref:AAA family ATPase n=1 Tax=Enterobacter roggenkampii TaxID=1812935 RepID=UPI00292B0D24